MRRLALPAGLLALAVAAVPAAGTAADPAPLTVVARPGKGAAVAKALGRGALRVERRRGDRLQVRAAPARAAALAGIPGVAAAHPAAVAFADEDPEATVPLGAQAGQVISEGLDRLGAPALEPLANRGRGLVIAVLDLGFGTGVAARQQAAELPPAGRLEVRSFDAAAGLAGTNAYGNATNHGELVAQTVYDYAPEAHYVFVNYHTDQDFLAAVDWLVQRRPDIVVHSNSFLEGPFDGTGPAAQAVDRAAAAGILWVNSAGNYGEGHWTGTWADADQDDVLDWPNDPAWAFPHNAGQPITFAISWSSPRGAQPPDLDMLLQRLEADGTWTTVASSADRQSAGAPAAERITGFLPGAGGTFRVRVQLVSGPPPAGPLVMFSREIHMDAIGGGAVSSVPTPGDAAGSLTVGAVDWRGNRPKAYSSQGPTDDGRLKPDVVAPTNTRLAGPTGPREVGGTSNAAPNAAGAAAVLLAAQRAAGLAPSAGDMRDLLVRTALDLGAPGPDGTYGAGRVRVDVDPPSLTPAGDRPPSLPVRGAVKVLASAEDASRVAAWTLALDGVPLASGGTDSEPAARVDTRRLTNGPHVVSATVTDWPGNQAARTWALVVDNQAPAVRVRRVEVAPAPRLATAVLPARAKPRKVKKVPPRPRPVRVVLSARDTDRAPMGLVVRVVGPRGRLALSRRLRTAPTAARALPLGRLVPGRYVLDVAAADRAGNTSRMRRAFGVR